MTVPCEATKVVEITTECAAAESSCTSVILFRDWLSRSRVSPFRRRLDLCLRLNVIAAEPAFFLPLLVLVPPPLVDDSCDAAVFVLLFCDDDITVTVPPVRPHEPPVPLPGSWESLLSSWESRRPRSGGFSTKIQHPIAMENAFGF